MRLGIIVLVVSLLSCETDVRELSAFETDYEFSHFAMKEGFDQAFIKYAADSAVLLRGCSAPIVGKELIRGFYKGYQENMKLTWEPIKSEESGMLAYTYGKFLYSVRVTADSVVKKSGHYITIWKKQSDGSWRYILDGGTESCTVH